MKVVVVGAGYAGTIAANRLAKKLKDAEITVINPRPDFIERIRLHQQVARTGTAATPLSSMLRPGVTSRVATVKKVGDGSVTLGSGESLAFDYLFLAVGSEVTPIAGTTPVGTWEGAQQTRAALDDLPVGSAVTVIGGGLTGIETAAELAYGRPGLRVRLVGATIGASLSEGARNRVRAGLGRLSVEIVEDEVVEVAPGDDGGMGTVRFTSGNEVASHLSLWAIIGTVPDLAAVSGLWVDADGRAVVDRYLRSVSDPRIFVIGDCAAVPGSRPACATASPQGAHAADTLARMSKGRRPRPYSMGYNGQVLSLGRSDGILQFSRPDDTVRRLYVAGHTAAIAKESVNRYAKYGARTANYAWMPGAEWPKSDD